MNSGSWSERLNRDAIRDAADNPPDPEAGRQESELLRLATGAIKRIESNCAAVDAAGHPGRILRDDKIAAQAWLSLLQQAFADE